MTISMMLHLEKNVLKWMVHQNNFLGSFCFIVTFVTCGFIVSIFFLKIVGRHCKTFAATLIERERNIISFTSFTKIGGHGSLTSRIKSPFATLSIQCYECYRCYTFYTWSLGVGAYEPATCYGESLLFIKTNPAFYSTPILTLFMNKSWTHYLFLCL